MSKWTKSDFVEALRSNCSREIAKIGERIIEFSEDMTETDTQTRTATTITTATTIAAACYMGLKKSKEK